MANPPKPERYISVQSNEGRWHVIQLYYRSGRELERDKVTDFIAELPPNAVVRVIVEGDRPEGTESDPEKLHGYSQVIGNSYRNTLLQGRRHRQFMEELNGYTHIDKYIIKYAIQ